MLAHPIVKCTKPLAANASAAPLDVVKMKSALGALGHYEAPAWGVSQFPDVALFDAIKAFQKSQGLKVDGAIKPDGETEAALSQAMTPRRATTALQTTAQALQSLGRGGDELLAHITKEEAALLHTVTDGGSINPQTGLLEFFYGGFGGQPGGLSEKTDPDKGSGDGRSSFDPSADHKANQGSTLSGGTGGKKGGFGGGDNGSKTNGDDGQGVGGNAAGAQTGTTQDDGATNTKVDDTPNRRASAKEDTVPGDYLGGDGYTKKDAKDNELMDLTIEDVEKENKAIMEKSKKLAAEAKRKEEKDHKAWHEVPYWSPGLNPTPPTTPQGPASRWNNNPNPPSNPGEDDRKNPKDPSPPKSRPGDALAKQMQKSALNKFMEDVEQVARGLELLGVTRLSPMMTLPGFEDAVRKANQPDFDEEEII